MSEPEIPIATYRLQFNRDFTFAQAAELVPYLAALGISHCYASPYLRARPHSTHGYDIIDHNQLNPEIGAPADFERFVAVLKQHGMGQILDIVPNHMGVMGADNAWWLDVLENGEASNYAQFFDIDWQPLKDELQGKVLVPVLGDQYGAVLDNGELKLTYDAEKGEFSIYYHQHRFPIDPREYPRILGRRGERLGQLGAGLQEVLELQSLISAFNHLPARNETAAETRAERLRDKEIHKRRLATLLVQSPQIAGFVDENVKEINGAAGDSRSFDDLHELIKTQAYRLAYWRVAADDINYRRFFDINDLAGLRMENQEVFDATHRFVLELVRGGKVSGLRVDHPDGLFDPAQYFRRLQCGSHESSNEPCDGKPVYVVAEKILTGEERLPEDWPIYGTTGYDFANLVNGLFVDPSSAAKMDRIYRGFLGQASDFGSLLYRCKKIVMDSTLASELNVLANLLSRIALANRHTCDFTLNSLRDALSEIVANFPVYRTYITENRVSGRDQMYIEKVVVAAKKQSPSFDTSVFDFVQEVLLTRRGQGQNGSYRRAIITFAMKFQQFTGAVMAKGLEDTSFYRYNRLTSLNDVGGDPQRFGVTPEEFHRKTKERAEGWPHSLLTTSTHDSKRSEDVRARINVLSEIPAQWRMKIRRWRQLNQDKKRALDGVPAPSRNDEYLLYQALVGVWPPGKEAAGPELCERLKEYMLKAVREAKEHTSWANQNLEYESAVGSFVESVLGSTGSDDFLADFLGFQRQVARTGMLNSLSQTLIKLASPGVPDIYQGNELWDFSLVDPDSRRPVDYQRRQHVLQEFRSLPCSRQLQKARELAEAVATGTPDDGQIKMFLTWKALSARRQRAALFQEGDYEPLSVQGAKSDHVFAFARKKEDLLALVAVPRLCSRLLNGSSGLSDPELWRDTRIQLPAGCRISGYRNVMTSEICVPERCAGATFFQVSSLMRIFPWVLSISEE